MTITHGKNYVYFALCLDFNQVAKADNMANGSLKNWGFQVHRQDSNTASASKMMMTTNIITLRGALTTLMETLDKNDPRPAIPLGHGDPSPFPSFRTATVAEDAIVDAVRSTKYNCYPPCFGILSARR